MELGLSLLPVSDSQTSVASEGGASSKHAIRRDGNGSMAGTSAAPRCATEAQMAGDSTGRQSISQLRRASSQQPRPSKKWKFIMPFTDVP